MTFEKRIDREHPACVVLLVDQSTSMNEPMAGTTGSKAESVAAVVNSVLYELILRCVKSQQEGPRHYYDVGVIGYGARVNSLLADGGSGILVPSDVLGRNPLRVAEVAGQDGSLTRRPLWIEARSNGPTPMCAAFDLAGATVANWIRQHPESFPPIVVNITDGDSTDGDPTPLAQRLKGLRTVDGPLLLFNVNISSSRGNSVCFPTDPGTLPDSFARLLFHLSSELPDYMISIANASGYPTTPHARGFAFNADFAAVAAFLRIGTSTAQMDR